MRRAIISAAVLITLCAPIALAEQNRNQLKGFTPEGVFQFLGIDNVNIFNGNLVMTIPIGQEYPIADGLSYRFQLVCNANVWDSEEAEGNCEPKLELGDGCVPISAIPDRRANAGLGCIVSLGRLFPPGHITSILANGGWLYESPDGADHSFKGSGGDGFPCDPSTQPYFTGDNTYLRMRVDGSRRIIEFPDGAIHTFEPSGNPCVDPWNLTEITNRYSANFLRINYTEDPPNWKITDSVGRTHWIKFVPRTVDGSTIPMVSSVELEGATADAAETSDDGRRVKYSLQYTPEGSTIGAPFWDTDNDGKVYSNDQVVVPLLTGLTQPDGTRFEIDHGGKWIDGTSGLPVRIRLPTLGCIAWNWGWYSKPAPNQEGYAHLNGSYGITRRVVSDRTCPEPSDSSQAGLGVWTYSSALKRDHQYAPWVEMTNRVTDPLGNYVVHHFSVAPEMFDGGWTEYEYGAPFTHYSSRPDGLLLSRETFECPTNTSGACVLDAEATGRLLRREYVRYESDVGAPMFFTWLGSPDVNTRIVSSRIDYLDDGAAFTQTNLTDFDGYGHYRMKTQSGFFDEDPLLVETTDYRPSIDADTWLPNVFNSVTTRENGRELRTEYEFDRQTGVLNGTRVLRLASRSHDDILTIFGHDDHGNTVSELIYGGDGASLETTTDGINPSTNNCCRLPSGRPQYLLRHGYSSGVRSSSAYVDASTCDSLSDLTRCEPLLSLANYQIDPATGLVEAATDPAGVVTRYAYDALSRLKTIHSVAPNGFSTTTYDYMPATSSAGAVITETVLDSHGQKLKDSKYDYDDVGRLFRSSTSIPDDRRAVTEIEYDALGRKIRTSQPFDSTATVKYWNTTKYDVFGRPLVATAPDGALTTFVYGGNREVFRTSAVSTPTQVTSATTQEGYDARGRLTSVRERSADTSLDVPEGGESATRYTYDPAGRLLTATTDAGSTSQFRVFAYDGRGFLTSETHPENGTTTYSGYDARGHAGVRIVGDSTLRFTYDGAERLTRVALGTGEPIKEFEFAAENYGEDRRGGKLLKAIRHNRLPSAGNIDVTEEYEYRSLNGQMTRRTTLVERVEGANRTPIQKFTYGVSAYDDLGAPKTLTMPTCLLGGCVAAGVPAIQFERTNGLLTAVKGFATLRYHPSGMVSDVTHSTQQRATDSYAARYDLPRPSKITFTDCTNTTPYFLPGSVLTKVVSNGACAIEVTWPSATLCGGASNIKYTVVRNDGRVVGSCLTETHATDSAIVAGAIYSYKVIAEGPATAGGSGGCQRGQTVQIGSADIKFNSCQGETSISIDGTMPEGDVTAAVGVPKTFRAKLSTPNGPLAGEYVVFNIRGAEARVRTGNDGMAAFTRTVDEPPGLYRDGVQVRYEGGLLQPSSRNADLTLRCEAASFRVRPLAMNVVAAGTSSVLVTTSPNCTWEATPQEGAFFTVTPAGTRKGRGTFDVTIPSTSDSPRRSRVLVGETSVVIEQSSTCAYRFVPDIAYLPANTDGATTTIDVSSPAGCHWTVANTDAPWITFEGSTDGTGPGTIKFKTQRNVGGRRVAHLYFEEDRTSTVSVNQDDPPPLVRPTLVSDLSGGGTIVDGQNLSMRVWVEGSPLIYRWYVNGLPLPDCDSPECAQKTIGPGEPLYPAPGRSVTFQVEVHNGDGNPLGSVSSATVTWVNGIDAGTCKVPIIQDSTLHTNAWPSDQYSPGAGARVLLAVVGYDMNSGTAPLLYQWYHGMSGDRSSPVLDGTADQISVNPHQTEFYWCEVTSTCGSGSSTELRTQQSRTAKITVAGSPKSRVVRRDFTGDNRTDVLWRNSVTGQNEVWAMNGTTVGGTRSLPPNMNVHATIDAIGDINGDKRPDLIWRDASTGQDEVWLMAGTYMEKVERLEARDGAAWSIGASADFDNDGNHDLVWHNAATGENDIWFMEGASRVGTWALPSSGSGTSGLHGAGDFDGDGKPDLFFHDRVTGSNAIWLMNDAARGSVSSQAIGSSARRQFRVAPLALPPMTDPAWIPGQVADMNNDGSPDIVWRNVVTGENSVWLMAGTSVSATKALPTRADVDWHMAGGGSHAEAGSETRHATTIRLTVEPAVVGSAAVVTAILTSDQTPLTQRSLRFVLQDKDIAGPFLTGPDGVVTAALKIDGLTAGTYPNAITVRFDGDAQYAASSASADLTVTALPAIVTWDAPAAIVYGTPLGSAQLNATSEVPGTFAYDPPAGTVLDAGQRALNVTFTPSAPGGVVVEKSVTIVVTPAASTIEWAPPPDLTYGTPLSGLQLNAHASSPGTLTYDPPPGTVLPVGQSQILRVHLEPDDHNFAPADGTTIVMVAKGIQRIQWASPADLRLGQPLGEGQLNATVIPSGPEGAGALLYQPPAGTLLSEGIHQLTVTAAETPSYRAASAKVDVIVVRPVATVQWQSPGPIVYGTPLSETQLNATASIAGTFVYTPAPGTVLSAGLATLSVAFTPQDASYAPVTAKVTIEVKKVKPAIEWTTPSPIVYGTKIDRALNATANAPGVITYSPDPGTILDAGAAQPLHATLTPYDVVNYEIATATVMIDVAKAPQTIIWDAPTAIVYGTPLSANQLNAQVELSGPSPAGALQYSRGSGSVLDAGPGQLLTVTVAETPNYLSATASVTIDVLRAALNVTADAKAKVYGAALPELTGVVQRIVNDDPITVAYATTATLGSSVGTYTITPSLTDPHGRLRNYEMTITPSELIVVPAQLTVAANAASKQYSDAIPPLTVQFIGLVLDETPQVLGGNLEVQTPATPLSAPGEYPITAGGMTSSNYAITYVGSMLTVVPEDARVEVVSPSTFTVGENGQMPILLAATVSDISATADAGADTMPGDIRNAAVSFIERLSGNVLCTAPIGLLRRDDQRSGVASCTATIPTSTVPAELTVGVKIGGFYVRDDHSDDVSVTGVAATEDFLTGGGAMKVSSAAGERNPDIGGLVRFDTTLQYDKAHTVKGNFQLVYSRLEEGVVHQYRLSADSVSSLTIRRTEAGGIATVVARGTLRDVTTPSSSLVVAENAPLFVIATDGGESNGADRLGFFLLKRDGGLWLVSGWSGVRPADLPLETGNLAIHYKGQE